MRVARSAFFLYYYVFFHVSSSSSVLIGINSLLLFSFSVYSIGFLLFISSGAIEHFQYFGYVLCDDSMEVWCIAMCEMDLISRYYVINYGD